jgi:hypothetical protein
MAGEVLSSVACRPYYRTRRPTRTGQSPCVAFDNLGAVATMRAWLAAGTPTLKDVEVCQTSPPSFARYFCSPSTRRSQRLLSQPHRARVVGPLSVKVLQCRCRVMGLGISTFPLTAASATSTSQRAAMGRADHNPALCHPGRWHT